MNKSEFSVGDIVTYKLTREYVVKAMIKEIFISSFGELVARVSDIKTPSFVQLQLVKNLTKFVPQDDNLLTITVEDMYGEGT